MAWGKGKAMRRGMRQRALAAGITGCLVVGVIVGAASAASAAVVGPYNIDGNVPDAGATSYTDPNGNMKELGPLNSSTTKIGVIHSDALPTLDLTNPNAQVDLNQVWLATQRVSNKDYLYFAWQRDKETGSGFIAYEFMKNAAPAACAYGTATEAQLIAGCNPWANRQAGDFMILWDQQGGSTKLYVRTWSGTAPNLTLSPLSELPAGTYDAKFSADGFRGEAAINLTDNGMGSGGACLAFANVIPSTVTGNSDTADYKDTVLQKISLSNCNSTTVTTPSGSNGLPLGGTASIGTGVLQVKDSALVSVTGGNATPAGSVDFWLCKKDSGTCDAGGTHIGPTSLSGASYPVTVLSPSAWVTSAGRYCWRAEFSGDAANSIPSSKDSSAGECFTVTPVTPTLSTTASDDVVLGNAVSDQAVLSGTATQPTANIIETSAPQNLTPAGGNIVFKAHGPGAVCSGTPAYTSGQVTVSGDNTYSNAPAFVPTDPGTYHWVAVYSGSSPNTNGLTHNGDCTDGNEDVTVNTVPSSMTTAQTWVPNDSATVSAAAGGNVKGTVTFTLFATNNCTGAVVYTTTASLDGPSPQTGSTANTTAVSASGSYSWQVSYHSDNPAQRHIAASCHETSSLTIANGGTATSD